MNTTALERARNAYEHRTDLKVVPIRLSRNAREQLDQLSKKYGGKRKAVEKALETLMDQ